MADCEGAEAVIAENGNPGLDSDVLSKKAVIPHLKLALAICYDRRGAPFGSFEDYDLLVASDIIRAIKLYGAVEYYGSEDTGSDVGKIAGERRKFLISWAKDNPVIKAYIEREQCFAHIQLVYDFLCGFTSCPEVNEKCRAYKAEYDRLYIENID